MNDDMTARIKAAKAKLEAAGFYYVESTLDGTEWWAYNLEDEDEHGNGCSKFIDLRLTVSDD